MLIAEVSRLAAELSQPCSTGTEVLQGKAGLRCPEECDSLCRCPGHAEGGSSTGPRAACLGCHWSRGGAGRGASLTLKILIEMKRCSEGAHSSGLAAGAAAAGLWERPFLSAGPRPCASRGDRLLELPASMHL